MLEGHPREKESFNEVLLPESHSARPPWKHLLLPGVHLKLILSLVNATNAIFAPLSHHGAHSKTTPVATEGATSTHPRALLALGCKPLRVQTLKESLLCGHHRE